MELNNQIDELKSEILDLKAERKEKEKAEGVWKKEIQSLKYDNKRQQFEFKDAKDNFEKQKQEYLLQFSTFK